MRREDREFEGLNKVLLCVWKERKMSGKVKEKWCVDGEEGRIKLHLCGCFSASQNFLSDNDNAF
ncbi:hypothetical protein OIU76_019082 [Salix suchowensis]|nr:hypothetical protein OIU76_019082 [Salix suchowensis]